MVALTYLWGSLNTRAEFGKSHLGCEKTARKLCQVVWSKMRHWWKKGVK